MYSEKYIKRFIKFLKDKGCEIQPNTNQYEVLRFKGKEVGIIYKTGKTNGKYCDDAILCFDKGYKWSGAPLSINRKGNYRKEKEKLYERDGDTCFYCGEVLGEDITVEHLIPLSQGGQNNLYNMVLAHSKCNIEVGNIPIFKKIDIAIEKRLNNIQNNL